MPEEIFGDFQYIPDSAEGEGEVTIIISPLDLLEYWGRCGLLADFGSAFYAFTRQEDADSNIISTVFNELIENAAKYTNKPNARIRINGKLFGRVLRLQIENSLDSQGYQDYRAILERLFGSDDLETLYIQLMEEKAENMTGSGGIGLLMLIKDYPIKLGVRFNVEDNDNVTTIVRVFCLMEETND